MRITTSKSKNSESFYITKSYTNDQGKSTSKTIRKLGTLAELSKRLGTDRDGVMTWANEQARLETLKYKSETEDAVVLIPFFSWETEMTESFIMTVQTTISKLSRKMGIRNTEKARNTDQTRLSRWDSLRMVTDYRWLFLCFRVTRMSRNH